MTKRVLFGLAALGFLLAVGFSGMSNDAQANQDTTAAVRSASDRFYGALNAMFKGELAPMEAVWSHRDDVTYMGPTGGYQQGWAAVREDWRGQAALKLGGKVTPTNVRIIAGRDVAVVTNYEEGENTNADGKVEKLRLRATSMYRLENGQWKMVGHHTDPLPYLAK